MKRLCLALLFMWFAHETTLAQNPIVLKANTYGIMDASGKILEIGYFNLKRTQGGNFLMADGMNTWYNMSGELYSNSQKKRDKKDEKRKEKQDKIKNYVAPIALVPAKVKAVAGVKNVSSYGCGVYSIQEFNYSRLVDSMGNDLGVTVGRKEEQTTAYIDSIDYPFIDGTAIFHTTKYKSPNEDIEKEKERAYWAEFHRKEQAELLQQKLKKQGDAKAIDEYINGVKCEECEGTGKVSTNTSYKTNATKYNSALTVNSYTSRTCSKCNGKGKHK